jgi:hypothetical protein
MRSELEGKNAYLPMHNPNSSCPDETGEYNIYIKDLKEDRLHCTMIRQINSTLILKIFLLEL